jgi:hypothetical protein
MKTRKINRTFNVWTKKRTEEGPPDDSHYSITRDRGTVKAETHLANLTKPGGKMPVPPPLPRVHR